MRKINKKEKSKKVTKKELNSFLFLEKKLQRKFEKVLRHFYPLTYLADEKAFMASRALVVAFLLASSCKAPFTATNQEHFDSTKMASESIEGKQQFYRFTSGLKSSVCFACKIDDD